MSTPTETLASETSAAANESSELQDLAQKHLLMHFTGARTYTEAPPTIMVKGEGCWLEDEKGTRYLDALAGLYCVQIGYSHGEEIGDAVKAQMSDLPYYSNWGYAHPPAVRLAAKVAELAPDGLDRVFLTSGGAESNEAAIKLIRQYHQAKGEGSRIKFLARRNAYHGTSFAALSINGLTNFRKPFEPLMYGARHFSNTNRYRRPINETEEQFTRFLLQEIEELIHHEGPDTVAGIFIEPLQNAAGSVTPPRGYGEGVRAICDKYGILLVADEVITGFGRLGEWFGSTRFGIKPDIITCAKGISSAYAPLGAMIASSDVVDTVLNGPAGIYMHGLTYGGHPTACAAGLANLAIMEREDVLGSVRHNEDYIRARMEELGSLALVGDVRGAGYHWTLELATDKEKRSWDGPIDAAGFVADHLAPALLSAGVLCRAAVDQQGGGPLIQFSPPLIINRDEIDWLADRVSTVLKETEAILAALQA